MRPKPRRWDTNHEDDPLSGLVNLFDLWMVFSIALLLALVGASQLPERSPAAESKNQSPSESSKDAPAGERSPLDRLRISHDKATGEGQRLGTAYRLKNGDVVYVPD